jgi:hypothetical protein
LPPKLVGSGSGTGHAPGIDNAEEQLREFGAGLRDQRDPVPLA